LLTISGLFLPIFSPRYLLSPAEILPLLALYRPCSLLLQAIAHAVPCRLSATSSVILTCGFLPQTGLALPHQRHKLSLRKKSVLEATVMELLGSKQAPVYVVHFTQNATAQTTQNLLSQNYVNSE
jgi:hypothetical protein